MLSEQKWPQYGEEGIDIKGIVIHNTKEYDSTAASIEEYFENSVKDYDAAHYVIDNTEMRQLMPETWKVRSNNKGNDWAFSHCISIIICSNENKQQYLEGQELAIMLIKYLMLKYNLEAKNIYFHNNFDTSVYCPSRILDIYGNKTNFIEEEIL